jgi:hypothetical protein
MSRIIKTKFTIELTPTSDFHSSDQLEAAREQVKALCDMIDSFGVFSVEIKEGLGHE